MSIVIADLSKSIELKIKKKKIVIYYTSNIFHSSRSFMKIEWPVINIFEKLQYAIRSYTRNQ